MTGTLDVTYLAAFAVGFVSFISPCVLPLVPGYLSAVSGVSVSDMQDPRPATPFQVLGPAIVFCGAFTLVFVALGMSATGLGSLLKEHRLALDKVAGFVIIALGVVFIATPAVPRLNREWRVDALMSRAAAGGPLIAGAAFALAWTPCVGPTLGAILNAAAVQTTVGQGGLLLAVYSGGLALPFLITALAFQRSMKAFRWLRDHYVVITAMSGLVLIMMGILVLTGDIPRLNAQAQDVLQKIGLDFYSF